MMCSLPTTTSNNDQTLLQFPHVRLERPDENKTCFGDLHIGENWFCLSTESDPENSFRVEAKNLVLQAICREHQEKPSIYCQVESNEEEFETIYIIPEESSLVDKVFEALCELVRRNPVPLDEGEGSGEEEWYGNVPWSMHNYDTEQFEDAEEDETNPPS